MAPPCDWATTVTALDAIDSARSGSFSRTSRPRPTRGDGGGSGSTGTGDPAQRCSGHTSRSSSRKGRVTHIGFESRLAAKSTTTPT